MHLRLLSYGKMRRKGHFTRNAGYAMAILLQLRRSSSPNNENYPMLQEKTLHIFGAECIHVPEGSLESELEMK